MRFGFKYFLLIILISIPLFSSLDKLPIVVWDEARLANNAYEMLHNHNFIVTYYDGKPEMWNTKPPFMIWMQVLSMKIFGINELAVRLPSAMAGFFTILFLFIFSIKYLKNFWFGFIASLILVTSAGYVSYHSTRTGDYDALLAFFTTLSGISYFLYIDSNKNKYLDYFFLFIILGALTKGINALLFLPGIFIYTIYQKKIVRTIRNRHFYYGLIAFIVTVGGYYLLRESLNPGYLQAVWENELGGRYFKVNEGHNEGILYYYRHLPGYHYARWFVFLVLGAILGFFIKDIKMRKIAIYSTLMSSSFFLVISLAKTKLTWYDVPLYPYFAIMTSVLIYFLFDFFKNWEYGNKKLSTNVLPYLLLFLFFYMPYKEILHKSIEPKYSSDRENYYNLSDFLRNSGNKFDINHYKIAYKWYNGHILFYINQLKDKGIDVSFTDLKNLKKGDRIITIDDTTIDELNKNYKCKIVGKDGVIRVFEIE